MTPSERAMPVVEAVWHDGYGYVIALPGGREAIAVDAAEAARIIRRDAYGSAIRLVGGPGTKRATPRRATEIKKGTTSVARPAAANGVRQATAGGRTATAE